MGDTVGLDHFAQGFRQTITDPAFGRLVGRLDRVDHSDRVSSGDRWRWCQCPQEGGEIESLQVGSGSGS